MDSLLLRTAARVIMPLQLVFSIIALARGHNQPGGGFVGGLVAACGIALYGIAMGMPAARRLLRVRPQTLIGLGLLLAVLSGWPGVFQGLPYLTGLWDGSVPTLVAGELKFGTPLLFDTGVYLVVAGVAVLIVFTMAEDE
jgi:multicomponent Na+:H+ antiporter subunit B